ncbi:MULTISPECIES: hypothetical protein [unclassified Nodularia (in: cyanobacteria)]|uniref:hypothetical protein n=1 Tax=unclassified Nodularia (in: cyanobacteria) TaxID=2656917 RepID=UPI00187F5C3E|nr:MULTISPECIES: hypothetical protein [unclassified Nodularia (in: cyanobacteria)]MBE9199167.1 hypothetical protein [Nodularia sp. LEGE 06071]MCC2694107.1 hypothetical protein [Nodularia sp. LEGE 04288]
MSEKQKNKSDSQETTPRASGGYQTPIEPEIRKTGNAAQSDAKDSAKPEAPGEDTVAGSPNQGTESR